MATTTYCALWDHARGRKRDLQPDHCHLYSTCWTSHPDYSVLQLHSPWESPLGFSDLWRISVPLSLEDVSLLTWLPELKSADGYWLLIVLGESFTMHRRQPLPKNSRLLPFRPIWDIDHSVICVGGRISNSSLSPIQWSLMEGIQSPSWSSSLNISIWCMLVLKYGHVRKPTIDKTYICLFVCLTVKAGRLEPVVWFDHWSLYRSPLSFHCQMWLSSSKLERSQFELCGSQGWIEGTPRPPF